MSPKHTPLKCFLRKILLALFFTAMLSSANTFAEGNPGIEIRIIPAFLQSTIKQCIEKGILSDEKDILPAIYKNLEMNISQSPKAGLILHALDNDLILERTPGGKYEFSKAAGTFFFDLMAPIKRDKYEADIFIITGFSSETHEKLRITLIASETMRHYSMDIDIASLNQNNFVERVAGAIREGLSLADKLVQIRADSIFDVKESIASYRLLTKEGEAIDLLFNYDSMHEFIQNIGFSLTVPKPDGEYVYNLAASNMKLKLMVEVLNNKIVSYKFIPNTKPFSCVYLTSLKSQGGHRINIESDGQCDVKNITPDINPYLPRGYTTDESTKQLVELSDNYVVFP